MNTHKISLNKRLSLIKQGYSSDTLFTYIAIQQLADIPMALYLKDNNEKIRQLKRLLNIKNSNFNELTFSEIIIKLEELKARDKIIELILAIRIILHPLITLNIKEET